MVHTKVFVGNLSFKTREAELAAAFSNVGNVISANIITRGPRSLGYGFVELASEDDAQKAVGAMNKKEIDGREINVEVAKPREEGAPSPTPNGEGNLSRAPRGRRGGRGGSFPRGPRDFRVAPVEGGNFGYPPQGGRGRGGRRGGFRRGGRGGPIGASGERVPRNPPVPRPPRDETPRTPSTTTLFVANLPFSMNDNELLEIFKGLKATSAHIVRKRNNKSKGFGFVEFANQKDQDEALTAIDKKVVDGRELIVKVALTEKKTNDGEKSADSNAVPAEKSETQTSN